MRSRVFRAKMSTILPVELTGDNGFECYFELNLDTDRVVEDCRKKLAFEMKLVTHHYIELYYEGRKLRPSLALAKVRPADPEQPLELVVKVGKCACVVYSRN